MKTPIIALSLLLCLLLFCKEQPSQQNLELALQTKEDMMKANFMSLVEDGWNRADMEKLKTISAENYVRILNGTIVADNRNGLQASMNRFLTGFPDTKVTVDQIIIKDNNLVAHWTFSGTHTAIYGELPPTGKKGNIRGCSTLQFNEKGEIMREEVYYNELDLLRQLGYTLNPPVIK